MNSAVIKAEGKGGRIAELDGLRGVAIGLVLIWHLFSTPAELLPKTFWSYLSVFFGLTWSGVDLFFVLSGFLIGGILLDAKGSTNYFKVFYIRRFFRIVPIYFVVIASFLVIRAIALRTPESAFGWTFSDAMPVWTYLLFLQNFWMVAAGKFGCGWLAATWSLAVEEQFYLTLPSIIRFFSRWTLLAFVFAGIVIAPIARVILFRSALPAGWLASYVLLFCRADALLFGVICALLLRDAAWRERIAKSKFVFPALFLALAGVAVYLIKIKAGLATFPMASFGFTVLAALYACALLLVCTRPANLLSRLMRWSGLRWLGSIAYGAYLFHMPVQGAIYSLVLGSKPRVFDLRTLLLALLTLGLTLLFAHVSWNYFEKRLVQLGHRAAYEFESHGQGLSAVALPAGAPQ